MYAIKNFKKFKGHDGEPLAQGTLHLDNVKVADWSDDSHGGSLRLDFKSKAEEVAFLRHAKTYLSTKLDYDGLPYNLTKDTWYLLESAMNSMSTEHEEALDIARLCKKGICYRALHDGKPELFSVNAPFTATNVADLKVKVGTALLEILNETLKLPLIDEATAKLREQNAYYKKLCAKAIVFTVRQLDGTVVAKQLKVAYSPTAVVRLRERQPDLVEIVNERYL